MTLSEYIKLMRREYNISQRELAKACGLSTGYISLIEKEYNPQTGKKMTPTLPILNKLAKGMKISLDELLNICDDMQVYLSPDAKLISDISKKELDETDISEPKREMIELIMNLPDEKVIRLYQIVQAALEL